MRASHVQISALTKTPSYRLGSIFARKRLFDLVRRLLDAIQFVISKIATSRILDAFPCKMSRLFLFYFEKFRPSIELSLTYPALIVVLVTVGRRLEVITVVQTLC